MDNLTLNNFLRKECANYISSSCLGLNPEGIRFNIDGKCYILKNRKPCNSFEKYVFGYAKYLGCYEKLFKEYQKINPSFGLKEKVRLCECGNELFKRARYCRDCRKKKGLEAKRKYWRKKQGSGLDS